MARQSEVRRQCLISCGILHDPVRSWAVKTVENNRAGLSYVYEQLRNLDLDFISTQANFVAVKLGADSGRICDRLMKEGVLVRNMESFNMAEYIRVSIGLPEENERFINALEKILAS